MRSRVRPTEFATVASALILLFTGILPGSDEERPGVLVAFAMTIAYVVVWYHVLPARAFGRARYAIGGGIVQVILVFLLVATGGVRSAWFIFYLLPVLATVFSYHPRSTATVAGIAVLGLAYLAFVDPTIRTTTDVRDLLLTRAVGYGAIAVMAYTITRAMCLQRVEFVRQEAKMREVLATTEREAMTDPLTAVHNRRALDQALARAASRAARDGHPYSVLLIDVDGLKVLNDREGHAAGDRALRLIATAASEVIRGYDIVARFGGDEFVVVLHDGDLDTARTGAERIRDRAKRLLGSDPMAHDTTISIGCATWRAGLTPEDLLVAADKDMYRSKRERRAAS